MHKDFCHFCSEQIEESVKNPSNFEDPLFQVHSVFSINAINNDSEASITITIDFAPTPIAVNTMKSNN